jgi:MSHA biogenesis protein MshM
MYLDYFGLKKQPFGITPDTSLFFKGAERGEVLEAILYALNSGEGIIKVVGEVGSGKTMLSRMLTKKAADNTVFVFLLNPSIQAEQVLYAIAYDLGLKVDASDQSIQVLHELQKKLFELYQEGKKVVLIIDEAQQMPLATLEEIRLLSNLETETEKLLQIIMFGQPELDMHIDTVEVRQLRERITYSFYLNPLSWELAERYLAFRLEKAGHQGRDIFKQSAIKQLTKCADGTLRRLNVLADKALLAAFIDKSTVVEAKHVKIALQDGNKRNTSGNTAYIMAFLSVVAVLLGVAAFYWFVQFKPVSMSAGAKQPVSSVVDQRPSENVTEVKVVKDKVVVETLLDEKLVEFDAWQSNTSKKYTIRLMSASGSKTALVEAFLKSVQNVGDIDRLHVSMLKTKSHDYVVYYGEFDLYSDALKTLNTLSKKLKKFDPYISAIPK